MNLRHTACAQTTSNSVPLFDTLMSKMLAVADILEQPPSSGKYEKLNSVLIERFSDSLEKQLRKLLDGMELENKTLSMLLREMWTLAGINVTDSMLRTL